MREWNRQKNLKRVGANCTALQENRFWVFAEIFATSLGRIARFAALLVVAGESAKIAQTNFVLLAESIPTLASLIVKDVISP